MLRKIINIKIKSTYRDLLLSVLSGGLLFLAFPPFELVPLAWVAFVPLFFVIKSNGPKAICLYSWISGLVFFGCLLYWLPNVTVPGAIILVLILSGFFVLFGMVTGYVMKYSMNLFILSFVWVVLEYIRAHLLTGFPWGMLGYTQYRNLNLIQIADISGVYGVSFIVITFNVAFFTFLARYKKRISYLVIALLFVVVATSYGIYRIENFVIRGDLNVSVVQGNIPQDLKWDAGSSEDILDKYMRLTKEAATDASDIIIWPETSYPYLAEKRDNPVPEISKLSSELKVPILAGIVYGEGDNYYNSAVLFNEDKGISGFYSKTHLVPFGEFIPMEEYFTAFRNYIDKPIGDFKRGDEYTLFSVQSIKTSSDASGARMRQISFYKFGVLICFEDIFPYIAREFVQDGAKFLVNITNDAWFGRTAAARQHLQASVFRAVENRVPVIRAANTGISCFIDFSGKINSILNVNGEELFVTAVDTAKVSIHSGRSYYTVCGDNFVYFCGLMMVLLMISEGYYTRKKD